MHEREASEKAELRRGVKPWVMPAITPQGAIDFKYPCPECGPKVCNGGQVK